jgi:hypothetical protein
MTFLLMVGLNLHPLLLPLDLLGLELFLFCGTNLISYKPLIQTYGAAL